MSIPPILRFLGAAGTVTGSRYLLEFESSPRILVDCGLFQGFKRNRLKNWSAPPFEPDGLDAVVLTHAHIDHSGYLPRLVASGYRGPIFATEATYDLCRLLLPDSGRLHELDAEYANRKGFSKHAPALPLYTEDDAHAALRQFEVVELGAPVALGPHLDVTLSPIGHIIGAASASIRSSSLTTTFSGDIGRYEDALMPPPQPPPESDYLVVESTYGNRRHPNNDTRRQLAEVITRTVDRGGTVIVPAFAVARTQCMLLMLSQLQREGRIPDVEIYVDSPMATSATAVYRHHRALHRLDDAECERMCELPEYVRDTEASKALDRDPTPKIIVSASGMATGGRVTHHLAHYLPDPRSTVLFTGFQARGTRGDSLVSGAEEVKIHGAYVPVRAEVTSLDGLSAHADSEELLRWLAAAPRPPRRLFITHGEPSASEALRRRVQDELGWSCVVPEYGDAYVLQLPA